MTRTTTDANLAYTLKPFFLVVDIGFILYWTVTLLHLIPEAYLFKDYEDPILVAWNWSFLPLDLFISVTGLGSLYLLRRGNPAWRSAHLARADLLLGLTSARVLDASGGLRPRLVASQRVLAGLPALLHP